MKRKLLIFVIAALVVLTFAVGCDTNTNGNGTPSTPATQTAQTAEGTQTPTTHTTPKTPTTLQPLKHPQHRNTYARYNGTLQVNMYTATEITIQLNLCSAEIRSQNTKNSDGELSETLTGNFTLSDDGKTP